MATGTLYRPHARNEHGDPVDADGIVTRTGGDGSEIGTVSGLILGGPSWRPVNTRGDVVDTSGLVGVPASEMVQPTHGDLLVVSGVKYAVGSQSWNQANTLTGTPPSYTWFTITARSN